MDCNYYRFPCVLRSKLLKKELVFPRGVSFNYEPFVAYRVVMRKKDDNTPISSKDFQSYFELGKLPSKTPRGMPCDWESDPQYYAVSLFLTKEKAKQALKLPRPNKKMAKGQVIDTLGPQMTDKETQHVSWWLYENSHINSFKLEV